MTDRLIDNHLHCGGCAPHMLEDIINDSSVAVRASQLLIQNIVSVLMVSLPVKSWFNRSFFIPRVLCLILAGSNSGSLMPCGIWIALLFGSTKKLFSLPLQLHLWCLVCITLQSQLAAWSCIFFPQWMRVFVCLIVLALSIVNATT